MKNLRTSTLMTQKAFAEYFNIPVRTLQDWEGGRRQAPDYVTELIIYKLRKEGLMMRKYEIYEEVKAERTDVMVTPKYEDVSWHLHQCGIADDVLDINEECFSETKEEINSFFDRYTEESIEKRMLESVNSAGEKWWVNSTYEEIVRNEIGNGCDTYEEAEQHIGFCLLDGSLRQTEHGFVFSPL